MIDPPWIKPPPPLRLANPGCAVPSIRTDDGAGQPGAVPSIAPGPSVTGQDDAQFRRDAAIYRIVSRRPTPR